MSYYDSTSGQLSRGVPRPNTTVYSTTTVLTATQIGALLNYGVALTPSPPPGMLIVPIKCTFVTTLNGGTISDTGGGMTFSYDTPNTTVTNSLSAFGSSQTATGLGFTTGRLGTMEPASPLSRDIPSILGLPICMGTLTPDLTTTGSPTIKVTMFYTLVSAS